MSNTSNNSYPLEFKESSIKLALESNIPMSHVAKNLGISSSTLHTWVSKHGKIEENQMPSSQFNEIKRLNKALKQVTQERDLLKKAAAYFAKQTQ